jgi:hypothetical protein
MRFGKCAGGFRWRGALSLGYALGEVCRQVFSAWRSAFEWSRGQRCGGMGKATKDGELDGASTRQLGAECLGPQVLEAATSRLSGTSKRALKFRSPLPQAGEDEVRNGPPPFPNQKTSLERKVIINLCISQLVGTHNFKS